jgi:outer membrane protein TolC
MSKRSAGNEAARRERTRCGSFNRTAVLECQEVFGWDHRSPAKLAAAEREFEAASNEALGLVRDQIKKVETAAHHYELYRDKILPLARQTVKANRAGYEASNATFLELIASQRVLQEAESTYVNHLADYQIALAELQAIVGADDPHFFGRSSTQRRSK